MSAMAMHAGRVPSAARRGETARPPIDPRWRFARLLSAPHRLGFAAAALWFAASAGWWAAIQAARAADLALPWAVPAPVAHGLLFALGFMPLFIVGFLFTAGPRWLQLPEVAAPTLRRPVAALVAGWALALVGFHASATLAGVGVALAGAGWAAAMRRFHRLLRASPATDRLHPALVNASGAVGVVAFAGAAGGLAFGEWTAVRAATVLALWGFLAPTFATVSHRMIPFFGASALPALDAWRPNALLWAMLGALWLQGGMALASLLVVGPWPAAARMAQAGIEGLAAAGLLALAWRWGLVQSLRLRLLAMLHAGFVWLGLAFALAAASHAWMAASADRSSLGLAPLHALTMGYLGATLVAMVTRVTAGHSGRPLAVDGVAWALYWTLQAAVVLRVAAALGVAGGAWATLAAAWLWAAAAIGWAWRYGGWLGRPRIDGRPG
jgi:uncharacterized protein involved in response to NO